MANEVQARDGTEAAATAPVVSVAASLVVAGAPIKVASQDVSKISEQGIKFSLSDPVTLGTITDLLDWVNEQFGTSIDPSQIEREIKSIPDVLKAIRDILLTFWGMKLVVQVLNVDTKAGLFEISIMLEATDPPKILGVLEIESLGFGVSYTDQTPAGA